MNYQENLRTRAPRREEGELRIAGDFIWADPGVGGHGHFLVGSNLLSSSDQLRTMCS